MKPPLKPYTLQAKIGMYKLSHCFDFRNEVNESSLKRAFRNAYPFLSHLKCLVYEEGEEDKILKEYEKYKSNSKRALRANVGDTSQPSEATGVEG